MASATSLPGSIDSPGWSCPCFCNRMPRVYATSSLGHSKEDCFCETGTDPHRSLHLVPLAWAMMKILFLRWGAPTEAAETMPHSASYPKVEKSPRTSPIPRTSNPSTFSTRTYLGRNSHMSLPNSGHNHLSSSCPFRLPATLTGWHGNPPTRTSTGAKL